MLKSVSKHSLICLDLSVQTQSDIEQRQRWARKLTEGGDDWAKGWRRARDEGGARSEWRYKPAAAVSSPLKCN